MATYAYRWADGTVSVCSAKNKNEAMTLFDQFDGVSRKLIIRLKSPILFTVKADFARWWVLDADEPLGEDLSNELVETCYPNHDKALSLCRPDPNTGVYSKDEQRRIVKALRKDRAEAEERLKNTFPTLDIVAMFPKGLPGQKN
jgi:hypothetical protein